MESCCNMSGDPVIAPVRIGRPVLAAGLIVAAGVVVLVQFVQVPGSLQAAIYLLFFSVLPGGSALVIANRTSSSWLVTLLESVVISVAMWMTATLVMAYLDAWKPLAFVGFVAVLAAVAGAVELRRITR
jgi:hypothetical protein